MMEGKNSRVTAWSFSDWVKCIYYILMTMAHVTTVLRSAKEQLHMFNIACKKQSVKLLIKMDYSQKLKGD